MVEVQKYPPFDNRLFALDENGNSFRYLTDQGATTYLRDPSIDDVVAVGMLPPEDFVMNEAVSTVAEGIALIRSWGLLGNLFFFRSRARSVRKNIDFVVAKAAQLVVENRSFRLAYLRVMSLPTEAGVRFLFDTKIAEMAGETRD